MRKEWGPTQETFEDLLAWLDSDRERAGQKYESIRLRLIKIFTGRRCAGAERLADETIDRVMGKAKYLLANYEGAREPYFYGVAQKVYLEYLRQSQIEQVLIVDSLPVAFGQGDELDQSIELEYDCLERCLERLSDAKRELVLNYYRHEERAKISQHKLLAEKLGVTVNALRIRAHRIRAILEECVRRCLTHPAIN